MCQNDFIVPNESFWLEIREKFDSPLSKEFFVKLNNFLFDKKPLFVDNPDPGNENVQISHFKDYFLVYEVGIRFAKFHNLEDAVISAILIHHIFNINYPENMRNLGIFLSEKMGLSSMSNEELPARFQNDLKDKGL